MELNSRTYSNVFKDSRDKLLTLDDLKRITPKITVGSIGTGKRKRWFEKLMNKFGWYRSSEWYIIDSSKFSYWEMLKNKKPEFK